MFDISLNNIITITRGDDAEFSVELNIGTPFEPEYYEMTALDYVYFGVCEPNKPFEDAIIKKKLDKDSIITDTHYIKITLNNTDTEYLLPGVYYYEIKLLIGDSDSTKNKIKTLQSKTQFRIID